MRVISVNVNGLRSATSKGFFEWLAQSGADVVCLQEIRIQPHQLSFDHQPDGWHSTFFPAEKAGYAGTAINKTLFATGNDDLRPVMSGIFFELSDEAVRFVATDAHKLVRYTRCCKAGASTRASTTRHRPERRCAMSATVWWTSPVARTATATS